MTAPAAPPATPQAGGWLYLDGFFYRLGDPEPRPDGTTLYPFARPDLYSLQREQAALAAMKVEDPKRHAHTVAAIAEQFGSVGAWWATFRNPAFKANYNYKRDGATLEPPVWVTRDQLVAAIEDQADQLLAGPVRRRAWAKAARAAQRADLPPDLTGAWVLPGRVLLKPPCVRATHPDPAVQQALIINPVVVEPQAPEEAAALATAVLASEEIFGRIDTLKSWAPPAGVTLHPWEG